MLSYQPDRNFCNLLDNFSVRSVSHSRMINTFQPSLRSAAMFRLSLRRLLSSLGIQ